MRNILKLIIQELSFRGLTNRNFKCLWSNWDNVFYIYRAIVTGEYLYVFGSFKDTPVISKIFQFFRKLTGNERGLRKAERPRSKKVTGESYKETYHKNEMSRFRNLVFCES